MRWNNPERVRGSWTPRLKTDENRAHHWQMAGTSSYLLGVRAWCRRVFHPTGRRVTQSKYKRILARIGAQGADKFSTGINTLTHRIVSFGCSEYFWMNHKGRGKFFFFSGGDAGVSTSSA